MKRNIIIILFLVFIVPGFSSINAVNAEEPFDTYSGKISWNKEKGHLGNLAVFLRRNPETIAYIIFSVGEKDKLKKVKKRAERAKKYLISTFKIDMSRIIIMNGGESIETNFVLQPMDKNIR